MERKIIIPENVKEIMQKLIDNGFEAYIIGGFCRSLLLNEQPHDVDLFTNANGNQILEIFPQGKVLGGEERQSKILTVIVDGIEVSQYRSNGDRTETGTSFEKHISTCDFTINSIACDINGKIIDINRGKTDLRDDIIRFVGNPEDRIREDPLRLLRMIRFASKYKLDIVHKSYQSISEYYDLLLTLPGERIREELEKILVYPNSIQTMKDYGILEIVFPEFKLTYKMSGGEKHNETVFEHLNESYKTCCTITNDFKLRFATLFHDIGKGSTYELRCDNNPIDMSAVLTTTFYGHEEEGEKIFLKYAEKYKFSNEETKFISFLIRNHMYGFNQFGEINNNTLVKFYNKMEAAGVTIMDFVTMLYCDHQGNLAKPRIKFKDFIEGNFFYRNYYNLKKTHPFKVTDLEINGNDLIKMGYEGKDIGIALNSLFEMVLNGVVINRRDRLMEVLIK